MLFRDVSPPNPLLNLEHNHTTLSPRIHESGFFEMLDVDQFARELEM